MGLKEKNPEQRDVTKGGLRLVCSHVQAMRKTKGDNDCWLIGNSAGGEVALLCDDCAVEVDYVTDWRARYVLAENLHKVAAESQAQGVELIPTSDAGRKAIADLQKVN
jgi:hypothetical protein